MKLNFIVCCDSKGGIAKDGKIPWSFAADMRMFKEATHHGIVVMGARTRASLTRDLPNRHMVVLTRGLSGESKPKNESTISDLVEGTGFMRCTVHSIRAAMDICKLILENSDNVEDLWIIGGEDIYRQFMIEYQQYINKIYITTVNADFDCDKHFPLNLINEKFTIESEKIFTDVDRNTSKEYSLTYTIWKQHFDHIGY